MVDDLVALTQQILSCSRCPLREDATAPVPGLYIPNCKYFLLGRNPGKTEDKYGIPFIGQAGKRLQKLLEVAGIDVNECSIDNVLKCRTPDNRVPRKKEIKACLYWLHRAIALVKPENIITLGSEALGLFSAYGIRSMHGTSFEIDLPETEEL